MVRMLETTELRDGGTLRYDAAFWPRHEADALFAELRTSVPWMQERSRGRALQG